MGGAPLLKAFVIVDLRRPRKRAGAIVGGLVIGLIENLAGRLYQFRVQGCVHLPPADRGPASASLRPLRAGIMTRICFGLQYRRLMALCAPFLLGDYQIYLLT